jgi:serine/threonine protein phosphatase PrpC
MCCWADGGVEQDEFIVVGTDGLWDMLSPQSVVDSINKRLEAAASIDIKADMAR